MRYLMFLIWFAATLTASTLFAEELTPEQLQSLNFYTQPARYYSEKVLSDEEAFIEAKQTAIAYQKAVQDGDLIAEKKALQAIKNKPKVLYILTRGGALSASAMSDLKQKLIGTKAINPKSAAALNVADTIAGIEHAKKMAKAESLIEKYKKAAASGDEIKIKSTLRDLLENEQARYLMKGDKGYVVDDALKSTYGRHVHEYRTKPLVEGTAEALNQTTYTNPKTKITEQKFVVRHADGVERPIRAGDFKIADKGEVVKGVLNQPEFPGMDADIYPDPDVTIIDKSTGRPVKYAQVKEAMEKSAKKHKFDVKNQDLNITGMTAEDDYRLKARIDEETGVKLTPHKNIEHLQNNPEELTFYEGKSATEVGTHKVHKASDLQQKAYTAHKEYERFSQPFIDNKSMKGKGFKIPEVFNRPHPETGDTAMDILKKFGDNKIKPDEARRLFRQATKGVELEDAVYKIAGWSEFAAQRAAAQEMVAGKSLGPIARQIQKLKNSQAYKVALDRYNVSKNSRVGTVFREQLHIVRNSKVLGKGFGVLGNAIGPYIAAGDFSRFAMEEADIADALGKNVRMNHVMARVYESTFIEPYKMLLNAAKTGLEKGEEKAYRWWNDIVWKNFSETADKNGYIDAFGGLFFDGIILPINKGLSLSGEAAGFAWDLAKYAAYNSGNPLQNVIELFYRENEILALNGINMREQLLRNARHFADQADNLQTLISQFKKFLIATDPEDIKYGNLLNKYDSTYQKRYDRLKQEYIRWRTLLNVRYGGVHHAAIADLMPEMLPHLAKFNALPESILKVIDENFIKGLLSKVRVGLVDAESNTGIKSGGWVQFNSQGVEIVCRGTGPIITCENIPPGTHNMRVKVGDYEESQRTITIKPTSKRRYSYRINLSTEAATWAYISVTVRDSETREPIPGAKVTFQSDNAEDKTRGNRTSTGALQIKALNGNVYIVAEADGYHKRSKSLVINTSDKTEYQMSLSLQPDGSAKKKAEKEKPKPASGTFDCSQIVLTTNVDFSQWSCCDNDFERERVRAMCRGVESQASGKMLPYLGRITDSIREQEGDNYNPSADYSDYPTPYGTLREVKQCADMKVDNLCRKLGAPRSGEPDDKKEDEEDQKKQTEADQCYEKYSEIVKRAKASNASNDPSGNLATVILGASPECTRSYRECKDKAFDKGAECRRQNHPGLDYAAITEKCNILVNSGWITCAQEEVSCSEQAYKSKCGVKK